jgi:uncharacterized membrane protein HdeD (DUF308 family)
VVPNRLSETLLSTVHEVSHSWGWFLAMGIALIVLGVICVAGAMIATFATIFVLGWFLLIGGIVGLIHSIRFHRSAHFWSLFSALLRGFTGFVLLRYPGAGALALTMLLATFFIVAGLFRATGAGVLRLPRWGWATFSGIVSVVLGIMLLAQLPLSSLWFIGFAIGIDMVLEGSSLVAFGATLRRLPEALEPQIRRAA